MNKIEMAQAKFLNQLVTGEKFQDEDIDDYIYASLSQPPVKVVNKNDSEDEMNWTIICPTCNKETLYGRSYMLNGYIYCENDNCRHLLFVKHPELKDKYTDYYKELKGE